jgi:hypothetical protein
VRASLEGLRAGFTVNLYGVGEAPLEEIVAREHERLLVPIADDPVCAPFLPVLRAIGGTVWLHDWSLRSLAGAYRPALGRGGLRSKLAGLREGGLAGLRGEQDAPLNRSVVRFGDSFLVHDEETRKAVLIERNAPTPTAILAHDDQLAQLVEALPPHRTNRRSLISNAIEASDRARDARRAGTD